MKREIGKATLGSGHKMEVDLKTYNRSTHDLSYVWRNTQSVGTLVPFMKLPCLPGDIFDIDLEAKVLTHPTVGPLYGSYKLQLDVFTCPIRLYISALHNNSLKVGLNMSKVKLPKLKIDLHPNWATTYKAHSQVHPSSLLSYLGINGFGLLKSPEEGDAVATFNGCPLLMYWDIFKNYYANKQEDNAYYIGNEPVTIFKSITGSDGTVYYPSNFPTEIYASERIVEGTKTQKYWKVTLQEGYTLNDISNDDIILTTAHTGSTATLTELYQVVKSEVASAEIVKSGNEIGFVALTTDWESSSLTNFVIYGMNIVKEGRQIAIKTFPLENIDEMREKILQFPFYTTFTIEENSVEPYKSIVATNGDQCNSSYNQFGLALKTYQSDIFNNWINTEWIEGEGGINDLTAVSTEGGEFTIDALNIAQKVYNMLNRIALSDGTYKSWLETVYTNEFVSRCESPVYEGGMSQEIVFDEVVSTAASDATNEPLGSLAGRGKMLDNKKGGTLRIKVDEPSYLIGIVSITPRLDYSQGNDWDMTLDSLDDLHKPELDAIGFQDLPASWMSWSEAKWAKNGVMSERSFGKQPAWIQYMTDFNKTKGNFAINDNEAFMVLNRNYAINDNGEIADATTYIDPTKFNYVFADTNIDAQNFWVQIGVRNTARRKMSAKVIPNL